MANKFQSWFYWSIMDQNKEIQRMAYHTLSSCLRFQTSSKATETCKLVTKKSPSFFKAYSSKWLLFQRFWFWTFKQKDFLLAYNPPKQKFTSNSTSSPRNVFFFENDTFSHLFFGGFRPLQHSLGAPAAGMGVWIAHPKWWRISWSDENLGGARVGRACKSPNPQKIDIKISEEAKGVKISLPQNFRFLKIDNW